MSQSPQTMRSRSAAAAIHSHSLTSSAAPTAAMSMGTSHASSVIVRVVMSRGDTGCQSRPPSPNISTRAIPGSTRGCSGASGSGSDSGSGSGSDSGSDSGSGDTTGADPGSGASPDGTRPGSASPGTA